jgi:transcriptional regulator with XRE-family HTH domain
MPHPVMQDWRKIVGTNVRRLRQARNLTQEELAFESEIDLTYVGGIERGKRNPSLMVMARIALALNVELSDLLDTTRTARGPTKPLLGNKRKGGFR